jgi:cysteine-rich repeat protein
MKKFNLKTIPLTILLGAFLVAAFSSVGYANIPPECEANGPYTSNSDGLATTLELDGTGSSDPDSGDTLAYSWTTNCPSGFFDDSTSPMPLLIVDSSSGSPIDCNAMLTVTDSSGASDSCLSAVTIIEQCGNGVIDAGEECDDGNNLPGDGCESDCTFPVTDVTIDIKPWSFPNSINLGSKGKLTVAILTTDDFDATTVDPLSVEFGPDSALEAHGKGHIEDVDDDGDLDLVLHFKTLESGIACGETEVRLTGETFDGQDIEGYDSIQTVGCK